MSVRGSRVVGTVSALVLWAGVAARGAAVQPAADVIQDLEREVAPRSGAACPDERAYSRARPDPAGTPTVVGVGLYFQDVAALNDVEQALDIDVYLVTRWRDARLADAARGEGSSECPVPAGRLWMPALEPENLRGRQIFYPDRFLVDERGVVRGRVVYPLAILANFALAFLT